MNAAPLMAGAPSLPYAGQVALVTGGSRGLGLRFAAALARAGAHVAIAARPGPALDAAVEAIVREGGRAAAAPCDVTDPVSVGAAVGHMQRTLGPVDLLVNNAGEGGPVGEVWTLEATDWWRTLETHVRGSFLCAHAVLPSMVERRRGIVVNIVSHAGVTRWPTCSAYAVAKGALVKFTENLGAETDRHGVSVFAYHPGLLAIGMTEMLLAAGHAPDTPLGRLTSWFQSRIDAGEATPPERSVNALMHLASGRHHALNGCYLTVDDDLDALGAQRAAAGRHAGFLELRVAATPSAVPMVSRRS